MATVAANRSQFSLLVDGCDEHTFRVTDFHGVEHLSQPYHFTIGLRSTDRAIDPADIINKRASLLLYRGSNACAYSGVVTRFRFESTSADQAAYRLRLSSSLWMLSLTVRSRVFLGRTVTEIVTQVLEEAGMKEMTSFELTGDYPAIEQVVQYQESDLNFISRLMEERGIWYRYEEPLLSEQDLNGTPVSEMVVISDNADSFDELKPDSKVLFRPGAGLVAQADGNAREAVHELSVVRSVVPRQVSVRGFNYRTPESPVGAQKNIDSGDAGSIYEFGAAARDSDSAADAAERLRRQFCAMQEVFEGDSDCRAFRAGKRFSIDRHDRSGFAAQYVLTRVTHRAVRPDDGAILVYANSFGAVNASRATDYVPPLRARRPQIAGVFTAPVESGGAAYAALDDMGRYTVRFPFDISSAANQEASKSIRLASPYAGANYGMHFPQHEGAEMVLACIDGDPSRPLGLATVPNPATASPVTSANAAQNIIRTAGNNELLMDDSDGEQVVRLASAAGNALVLDDGNRRVAVQSEDENALILDDKEEQISIAAGKHVLTICYKFGSEGITISTESGHVVRLDDAGEALTVQSAGGHRVAMDDSAGTIILADSSDTSTVTLDKSKGVSIVSKKAIEIRTDKELSIQAASVEIGSSRGAIEVKATQALTLAGMSVEAKAQAGDVTLEGLNVSAKGTLKAVLDGGVGAEVTSKVQAKMSAAMTEVSASAVTTVKGAVVMIN